MLSKSTTPEIVREVPDNLPECYAKLASAPTPPHLKRRRHPSDRELAYLTRQGAQDEPEPARPHARPQPLAACASGGGAQHARRDRRGWAAQARRRVTWSRS